MTKPVVSGVAGLSALLGACQPTIMPALSAPTCSVTVNPKSGSLDTPFMLVITASNASVCTYGLDGKGTIPVACNGMVGAVGASFGAGTHTVVVKATGAGGDGSCSATWSVGPMNDMAGVLLADMSTPAVPDLVVPPVLDMTMGPPDLVPPPTMLDLHQATIFDNPPNLADWPITTLITDVEFQYQGGDGIHVEFSKRDGAGSWPDVTPPGWGGSLEYTLGMAEFINGQWYASAAIQFWRGLPASGGNVAEDVNTLGPCQSFGANSPCQVARNWYYDGRWGQLNGYQPAPGELIGLFVVAGNVRGVTDGSQSPAMERSNVVLMPMPGFGGAQYTF